MAKRLLLVAGLATTGKTASLATLKNPEGVLYCNTESNKDLPFASKFKTLKHGLNDPKQILDVAEQFEKSDTLHTIIIDSLTFLMERFESLYVLASDDTRSAWGDYQQFFKHLMQDIVAKSNKTWVFLAHNNAEVLANGRTRYYVPIKGALAKTSIEGYFSNIVYTRKLSLADLPQDYDKSMCKVTPRNEAAGYKYVYQVDITKDMVESAIRPPMNCFKENQIFMDNDLQALLDILDGYYGDSSKEPKQ